MLQNTRVDLVTYLHVRLFTRHKISRINFSLNEAEDFKRSYFISATIKARRNRNGNMIDIDTVDIDTYMVSKGYLLMDRRRFTRVKFYRLS